MRCLLLCCLVLLLPAPALAEHALEAPQFEAGQPAVPFPPLPDYLSDTPVVLTPNEAKALELAGEWAARSVAPVRNATGKVLYVHGASLPTIVAAPLNVCDVELQAGETLNEVVVGDSARWLVDVATSGAGEHKTVHLLIKPVDSGLESSAVVTTSRRVYHLRLISQREGHTPYVGFLYMEDQVRRFREQAEREAKEEHWRTASLDGRDVDLSTLNFRYLVKGKASWKPVQVYDDGRQTVIRLPAAAATNEMPVLLVRKSGSDVLVNYRVKGQAMVVDGLFEKVVLVVGVGRDQESIEITREDS